MDWYLSKRDDDDEFTLRREDGSVAGWLEDFSPEDAQLVLRAVNTNDQLVEALENALNGIDAALVDVRATRRRGSLDPGLEAAEYNLTHLMNDVKATLAAARGEGE